MRAGSACRLSFFSICVENIPHHGSVHTNTRTMHGGSTDASLEAFVGILQKAFANPEICLRVLQRSLDLMQVVNRTGDVKGDTEAFRAQMQKIAAIFDDLCREGTTRVRVAATGVCVRRHFCITEADFRLLRDVKNFALAREGFARAFKTIKLEVRERFTLCAPRLTAAPCAGERVV